MTFNEFLFYLVVLLSNIIQGITGFAGTILAMPFSIKLVGMGTAVPVLNLLGLISGIYVFAGNYKKVDWKVLRSVVLVMGICVVAGLFLKNALSGRPTLLYMILGTIVIAISIHGLFKKLVQKSDHSGVNGHIDIKAAENRRDSHRKTSALLPLLLVAAGIVHGMFVCGGPLLISYMTKKLPEKAAFRATISTMWIFLNGIIFASHIITGAWTPEVIKSGVVSIPFLLGGMFIGGVLYKKMSQQFFILLTYILLFIAGLSLFFK